MSARKRRFLLPRRETHWTCHCPLRGTIPGQESGEETSKLEEGVAAARGKLTRLQKKVTVGEEGLLRQESLNQRGEDVVVVLNSEAVGEEDEAEADIWTEIRRGPMLTLCKRRRRVRTRP